MSCKCLPTYLIWYNCICFQKPTYNLPALNTQQVKTFRIAPAAKNTQHGRRYILRINILRWLVTPIFCTTTTVLYFRIILVIVVRSGRTCSDENNNLSSCFRPPLPLPLYPPRVLPTADNEMIYLPTSITPYQPVLYDQPPSLAQVERDGPLQLSWYTIVNGHA